MSTALKVAARKEKYPHLYCPVKRCLWHTGGGMCPRHEDELDEAREVIRDLEQERD